MMRLMTRLRRSVALIICPDLRNEAAQQREVSRLWMADDRPAAAAAAALAGMNTISPGSVGPCRGGSRPDLDGAQDATDQGVPRRSLWQSAKALNDRIENCWLGDLIGVAGLFTFLILMTFFVGVYE